MFFKSHGDLRMKKSLFALAALSAFTSAAQAQSSVTLYGTFDTSIAYLSGVQAATSATTTGLATFASAAGTTTSGTGTAFIDGSFATSSWGMRGSEDLGGGMKANFHLESDIITTSGNTHSGGLFRRAANVSIATPTMGEVFLGKRGNAYILATGGMLPVQGNTAHQWRSVGNTSVGDQIGNSVTYAAPRIMNTAVVAQYGLNNTIDQGDGGTYFAAHMINTSVKNLTISSAYNIAKAQQNSVSGVPSSTITSGGIQSSMSQGTATPSTVGANLEGYAIGLKYKVSPVLEVGTFYAHGRKNNGYDNAAATAAISTGVTGVGVGYQVAPNLLLGANYVSTTFRSNMTNLQAHYMLSKRTRLYSQVTLTQAPTGNYQTGSFAANSFSPIACNSSSTTPCVNALTGTAGAGNIPNNTQAYNVGIIHTF